MIKQVRRDRVLKPEEARGNVVLKAQLPHRKDRAAGVEARDQAEVPAGVRAADPARAPVEVAAKVAEKAATGGLNKSTN